MIYFVAAIAAVVSLVGVRADRHERCCCLTWHATESMTNSQVCWLFCKSGAAGLRPGGSARIRV